MTIENGMEYTTVKEIAKKWGVTVAFVYIAAKAGRIPGAEKINDTWYIPKDAENPSRVAKKPKDGYISSEEAAEKWGLPKETVQSAARAGRIAGAEFADGRWNIPEDAAFPPDRRSACAAEGYTSVAKTAQRWGASRAYVHRLVNEGRIPGAELIDGSWYIPENAERPAKKRIERVSGYMSLDQAAKNWGVTTTCVCVAAREGRIPGALKINNRWQIPEGAERPISRTITPKSSQNFTEEAPKK